METTVPVIKVENLVKRYGTNYALNDISFEIGEGEIVGLLGPNGAGKSTTMNILTGYLSSTAGAAYINGVDILEDPIGAKKHIGFLPEQPPIYPEMTVSEYLNFVYELKSCKLERAPHIAEILSVARLTDVKPKIGTYDDEAMFILGKATLNFIDLIGPKYVEYTAEDTKLRGLLEFFPKNDVWQVNLENYFTEPCKRHHAADTDKK